MAVAIVPTQVWYCPACRLEDVTHEARPHTRFHVCARLRGLVAPMLPVGTRAKVEIVERQDYIGKETVQLDPELGRPVQSIVTTRDNGSDCMVFAPTATGSSKET